MGKPRKIANSAKPMSVRVPGLTRLDAMDLQKRFPGAVISIEPVNRANTQHGELATVGVVVIALAGIQAVGAWLLKDRKNNKIEKTIEIVHADGSKRKEKISITINESTTDAQVVKQLESVINVDLNRIAGS